EKKSNGACGGSHLPGGILPGYGHVSGAVGGILGGGFSVVNRLGRVFLTLSKGDFVALHFASFRIISL
ncbi:MAG: hypothetical protein MPK13_02045, partial [Gammaproteobacteria bacterium]|nr:hypothetical protein [Gammaproteobacteria bacterium]